MYSVEHNKFIIESYFRNGQRNENDGEWKYSVNLCVAEFVNRFPDVDFDYDNLSRHVKRIVHRFQASGNVDTGKSPGRPTLLTQDTLEDIQTRIERSPKKPLRQLAQQTGVYFVNYKFLHIKFIIICNCRVKLWNVSKGSKTKTAFAPI